jgi:hypothetical protein
VNNATKFGDQLDGNTSGANEILYRLGLKGKKFVPRTYLSIDKRAVSKKDMGSGKYEVADKTMQELYALGKDADISAYKGKVAKNSNWLILGDKVDEYEQEGRNVFGQRVSVGDYVYFQIAQQVEGNLQSKGAEMADSRNYDFDVTGVTEANAREMKSIKEAAKKNGTFMKAPNGKDTKLNERQWLQVRTNGFRRWFGEWELAAKLQLIEDLAATGIKPGNYTREQLQQIYRDIPNGENKLDNRAVSFSHSIFGKMYRNENSLFGKIVPQLKDVFDNSIPIYSEQEQEKEGHKSHPNLEGYHNYLGKVTVEGKEYYVRFTVQEQKIVNKDAKQKEGTPNQMHNAFVSEVELYDIDAKNKTANNLTDAATNGAKDVSGITDAKLQHFFEKAREAENNSSKVVDENGEPLAVYHGSANDFTKFDTELVGSNFNQDEKGFFFTDKVKEAESYAHHTSYGTRRENGGFVYNTYLNIKKPLIVNIDYDPIDEWDNNYRKHISQSKNSDGVIIKAERGESMYVSFSPSQIKSATSNNGNFDSGSDDIRFQTSRPKPDFGDYGGDVVGFARDMEAWNLENSGTQNAQNHTKGSAGSAVAGRARNDVPGDGGDDVPGDGGDDGVRFQVGDSGEIEDGDVSGGEIAREELREKMNKVWYRLGVNWKDMHLPVKTFFEKLRELGVKIGSFNDFYQNVTSLSGKNDEHLKLFRKNEGRRLNEAVAAIDGKLRDTENYMMLKHGLEERNEFMRKQELEQLREKLEVAGQARNDVESAVAARAEKIKNKDYSGIGAIIDELNGVKRKADDPHPVDLTEDEIRTARDYIADFEARAGAEKIDALWKAVREATQYSLQKMYRHGMLSKDVLDELSERWQHYVPLRGHDAKTAEDLYDYTGIMGTFYTEPLMASKGRRSRADSPVAFIYQQAHTAINSAHMNTLKQGLLRIARGQDTKGLMSASDTWYEKVATSEGTAWEARYPEFRANMTEEEFNETVKAFDEQMEALAASGNARRSGAKFDIGGIFIKRHQEMQHAVRVFENGVEKTVYINAHPEIARAINGDNRVLPPWLAQKINGIVRTMSANMTSRNPAFVATNVTRDISYAESMLAVKEGVAYQLRFNKNIPFALAALTRYYAGKAQPAAAGFENLKISKFENSGIKPSNYYDALAFEFIINGGKTGYSHILELQREKKNIDREIGKLKNNDRNAIARLSSYGVNGAEGFLEMLQTGNDIAENISRLATYITSRETGRDVLRSVSDAKEVTVNFNRKGAGGMGAETIKPLYMFLNAGIQGLSNWAAVAKAHKGKMTAMVAAYALHGYLQPLLAYMIGGDEGEDEYWRLSDHDRKNNMIIPLGGGNFLMKPMPQELRVFHGIGDVAAQVARGQKSVGRGLVEALEGFSDLVPMNPLGTNGEGLTHFLPDAAKPVVQVETNKNYMGSPVYNPYSVDRPEGFDLLAAFDRSKPGYLDVRTNRKGEAYTPGWMIGLARGADHLTGGDGVVPGRVSPNPDIVNHLARGYFGGIYTLLSQSLEIGIKGLGTLGTEGTEGTLRMKDVPFLNRFYRSADDLPLLPEYASEEYYGLKERVEREKSYVKQYYTDVIAGKMGVDEFARKTKDFLIAKKGMEIKETKTGKFRSVKDKMGLMDAIKEIEDIKDSLKGLSGEEQKKAEREAGERIRQLTINN